MGEEITEKCGVFVLEPLQDVREVVFERPGEAVGEAHCVADQTAAMCDELCERTQRGALRDERLKLVAMREQQIALQCSIGGVVCRMTRSKGFTVLGEGRRVDGAQHQERVLPSGLDERTCVEFEAHRNGVACAPLLQGTCPRIDGLWCVCETTALPFVATDSLETDIVLGSGPIDTHAGRKFFLRETLHVSPPRVCESCGEQGHASSRSAKA